MRHSLATQELYVAFVFCLLLLFFYSGSLSGLYVMYCFIMFAACVLSDAFSLATKDAS